MGSCVSPPYLLWFAFRFPAPPTVALQPLGMILGEVTLASPECLCSPALAS